MKIKKTKKEIIPRLGCILVQPDKVDKKKAVANENGVYKPANTEEEEKYHGTVISVAPEVKDIKKGDRVIFGAFAGDPVTIDEVEYRLLHALETPQRENEVPAFLID